MDYFDYGRESKFDIKEFLEQSHETEQKRLEQELERIQEQLEQRNKIHEDTVQELESKLDWYIDRLETLYQRSIGKHGKREQLKNRIEKWYQQIRREKRSHWQDRQELEQNRRDVIRELEELNDPILDELLWDRTAGKF